MSHSQPNGGWINGKAENLGEPKFKGKTRKNMGGGGGGVGADRCPVSVSY